MYNGIANTDYSIDHNSEFLSSTPTNQTVDIIDQRSKYLGVTYANNKYRVRFHHNSTTYTLGCYSKEFEASRVYDLFNLIINIDPGEIKLNHNKSIYPTDKKKQIDNFFELYNGKKITHKNIETIISCHNENSRDKVHENKDISSEPNKYITTTFKNSVERNSLKKKSLTKLASKARKKSNYKNVSWQPRSKKWSARFQLNNKEFRLGAYGSEIEAAVVADLYKLIIKPKRKNMDLNFPISSYPEDHEKLKEVFRNKYNGLNIQKLLSFDTRLETASITEKNKTSNIVSAEIRPKTYRKPARKSASSYKYVTWCSKKNKWYAKFIDESRNIISLGYYKSNVQAARVADMYKLLNNHDGVANNLNFPVTSYPAIKDELKKAFSKEYTGEFFKEKIGKEITTSKKRPRDEEREETNKKIRLSNTDNDLIHINSNINLPPLDLFEHEFAMGYDILEGDIFKLDYDNKGIQELDILNDQSSQSTNAIPENQELYSCNFTYNDVVVDLGMYKHEIIANMLQDLYCLREYKFKSLLFSKGARPPKLQVLDVIYPESIEDIEKEIRYAMSSQVKPKSLSYAYI